MVNHQNGRDEYKEFERLIKDDLQEIDNRLEEEEVSLHPLALQYTRYNILKSNS